MCAHARTHRPVRTQRLRGEELRERYNDDFFDLVYCINAIDHAENPLLAIAQMLAVVKAGRVVHLRMHANEALLGGYGGFHR